MDNDLETLGTFLGRPGPSAEVVEAGRRKLEQTIRGQALEGRALRRRRRPGLLAFGSGLTAAAAVAAIAIAGVISPAAVPGGHAKAPGGLPVAVTLSGRQILLDAATTAAAMPQRSGTYWYLREVDHYAGATITQSTWTARSGAIWVLDPGGKGVWQMGGPAGFSVGGTTVTFSQLRHLPTTPAALKAWITRSFKAPVGGAAFEIPADEMPSEIATALSSLLYQVPAPPAVRAAAFRSLALFPDVKRGGAVPGGQKLVISGPPLPASKFRGGKVPADTGDLTLVVDPATSMVRSVTNYEGTETILAVGWTATRPTVVPLPPK